jgi:hypothetical protein
MFTICIHLANPSKSSITKRDFSEEILKVLSWGLGYNRQPCISEMLTYINKQNKIQLKRKNQI